MGFPWYTGGNGISDFDANDPSNYQISDEDRRRTILQNLLIGTGVNLANARRGQELAGLTNGLAQGGMMAQQAIGDMQRAKFDRIKAASMAMDYNTKKQDYEDNAKERTILQNYKPGQTQYPPLADMSPTPANAAQLPVNQPPQGLYEQLNGIADQFQAQGLGKKAEQYRELATKYKPKFSQTPQVGMDANGQPFNYVLDESGNMKRLDAGVKPDYKQVNTGGAEVFYDPITGRTGGQFTKTVSPDTKYTGDITMRGQNMTDARSREANAIAQNKPVWDATAGQFIYPPGTNAPTGAAVTPTGFTKPEKPLSESQAKATAFVNQMQNANRELADLSGKGFTAAGLMQQGDVSRASSEGIPYVPFSGTITRATASDNAQRYSNAELQWTEPVLRFLTGANAPKEEVVRNAATFFPRPGDSEVVVKQKEAARANMEQSIRLAAGAGSDKVPQGSQQAPAQPKQGGGYESLPSGAIYTAPDGTQRRKR